MQQPQRRSVVGEHPGLFVNDQQSLAHMLCESRELPALSAQVLHLTLNLLVLAADFAHQRRQLFIGLLILQPAGVQCVDRLYQLPGKPPRQPQCKAQGQQHHGGHRLKRL